MARKQPNFDVAFVTALEGDLPVDTLHLVTQTALMAIRQAMLDEAGTISRGLVPFERYYSTIAMAQATVAAATQRNAEALEILEQLIAEEPDFDAAVCACAMLKKEAGSPGWRNLAQRVVKRVDADPHAAKAAKALLEMPLDGPAGRKLPGASADQVGLRFA